MKTAAFNEFLVSVADETATNALQEHVATQLAGLLSAQIIKDLGDYVPFEGYVAAELRCVDEMTIPLQKTMQRLVAGEFIRADTESNVIVLLASSTNSGRYLEKLAGKIHQIERKMVCFYSIFSVDGDARRWVLKPGVPTKMSKIVEEAVTTKIFFPENEPLAIKAPSAA
jgi:hypothetical protein